MTIETDRRCRRAKDRRRNVAVPRRGCRGPNTIFGWDDAIDAKTADLISTQDAVILGRRSYDEWVGFWPGSDIEPFATFINEVPKHAATSTALDQDWANTSVIEGGLVDFVRDFKQQPGGDIGVHASLSVAQGLLAADLVDELRLVIGPMIVGRGRRLLEGCHRSSSN